MLSRIVIRSSVWLLLALFVSGCGKAGPEVKTVDVSGTVYLDDRPAAGVTVVFVSDSPAFTGTGETGEDGKYRLDQGSIPGKRGAAPGKNKVYFSKATKGSMPAHMQGGLSAGPSGDDASHGEQLPAKYSNPLQPAFTFDVPGNGSTAADFKLTTK